MRFVQIVFSPTGGTQKVADTITSQWGKPVEKIDLSDTKTDFTAVNLEKEDIAVVAVPSFGDVCRLWLQSGSKKSVPIRLCAWLSVYMATGPTKIP